MTVHKRIESVAYVAGADYSAYQFHAVAVASDGQLDPSVTNGPALGILLNKPGAQGAGAEVAIQGSDVKMVVGEAVDEGDFIVSGNVGFGMKGPLAGTAAGTTWLIGICTQSASGSGALAGVLITGPSLYLRP